MSRQLDRRQALRVLLMGSTALGSGLVAGCAGGRQEPVASTGSIGTQPLSTAGAPQHKPSSERDKVALLLPMSAGPQMAAIANALKQSAELAIVESRTADIELIVKDDKGTEAGAKAAAEDAVKGGAAMIIGPLFSKTVKAAAPIARAANVPLISLSNDPSVAGSGIYLLGGSQASEVERGIGYAAAQGRRRFAALLPSDAEGHVLEPAFKAAVARAGGTVVAVEKYKYETNGLIDLPRAQRDSLKVIADGGIDALFLPGGQDTLPQLASLLNHASLPSGEIRLIGTGGWDYPHVGRQQRLAGAWFAAPDPKGWHDFAERFGRAYKTMPPRLATLSHDAVVMAIALAAAPKACRFQAAELTRVQGFTGADGTFRFTASGHVERGLAVLEVQKQGPVVVDAPALPSPAAHAAHALGAGPRFN